MAGAERLFHTIVVVGAGLPLGCGGRAERSSDGAGGSANVDPVISEAGFGGVLEPPGIFLPSACASYSQYRCESYSPLQGCVCDPSSPLGPEDCGGATKISCDGSYCGRGVTCDAAIDRHIDCHCVPDAPDGPDACGGSGQFQCVEYTPEYRDCRCDPARPGTPAACAIPEQFHCRQYSPVPVECSCDPASVPEDECPTSCDYSCASDNPRFGCDCRCIVIR